MPYFFLSLLISILSAYIVRVIDWFAERKKKKKGPSNQE